jgi:hypothetical protein
VGANDRRGAGVFRLLAPDADRYTVDGVMRSVRSIPVLLSGLLGTACTGAHSVPASSVYAEEGSVGVLHVERIADEAGPGAGGRTFLSAAFARYRGLDVRSVVGLLGSGPPAELDSCAWAPADDRWVAESAEVELLDVGTIRVRVGGTETYLVPRAFPDLASVLAGVFYAGEWSAGVGGLAVPRADLDEYTFQASGSAEVPAFEAVVPAPGDLTEFRLDGKEAAPPMAIARDVGLEVHWGPGDPRDTIEIEVRSGGELLACAARDDGAFRIAPEALVTLPEDPSARLTVRRVRASPVDVPRFADAIARVAVTRVLDVELR